MKNSECFECGATEDLQQHHVVPKSRGGTKTIPLCTQCHGKAHGRDLKGLEHSRLTKEGIERARQRGVKLGSPKLSKAQANGVATMKKKADELADRYGAMINDLRLMGKSYRECGEILNIRTKKGNLMGDKGVSDIHKRYQKIKKILDKPLRS